MPLTTEQQQKYDDVLSKLTVAEQNYDRHAGTVQNRNDPTLTQLSGELHKINQEIEELNTKLYGPGPPANGGSKRRRKHKKHKKSYKKRKSKRRKSHKRSKSRKTRKSPNYKKFREKDLSKKYKK